MMLGGEGGERTMASGRRRGGGVGCWEEGSSVRAHDGTERIDSICSPTRDRPSLDARRAGGRPDVEIIGGYDLIHTRSTACFLRFGGIPADDYAFSFRDVGAVLDIDVTNDTGLVTGVEDLQVGVLGCQGPEAVWRYKSEKASRWRRCNLHLDG